MPEIKQFMERFYILDDWVRQFLIVGEEEALLIDTGVEDSHVAETVRQVTGLPVRVVLTHGDHDHTGGLPDFSACRIHPGDGDMLPPEIRWEPLEEGEILECGGYRLEVISIPGHTPGSIALLDREHGLLLPGDSLQKEGTIYMFGPRRNLDQYIRSLEKLVPLEPELRQILPCHGEYPIEPAYISRVLEDALALREGKLPSEPHPTLPCRICRGKGTAFLRD